MTDYRLRGAEALAKAVENEYTKGLQDYHLKPLNLLDKDGKPVGTVKADDGVIFCCRRGEREVELTDAFTDPDFKGFDRKKLSPLDFVILTMYNEKYTYLPIAFAPDKVQKTLAQVLSENGKTQFHLAESEKYAHVTFFFNGGNQKPFAGEEDCRIPSPKGIPFDQVPELSLPKVAERLCQAIDTGYDFIVTNYANGDVIGHTSNDDAKRKATPAVDKYVKQAIEHAIKAGYRVLLTADHGNIENMSERGHTRNPVPFIARGPRAKEMLAGVKSLVDVTPAVLRALRPPEED